MKVYLVSSGSYSDYSIDRVFTTLEKAELWVGACNGKGYEIDEWDVDQEPEMTHKKTWVATFQFLGTRWIYSFDKDTDSRYAAEGEIDVRESTSDLVQVALTDRVGNRRAHYSDGTRMFSTDPYGWMDFTSYVSEEHAQKLAVEAKQEYMVARAAGHDIPTALKLMGFDV